MKNWLFLVCYFTLVNANGQEFGQVCSIDLNIDCQRPANYLDIVVGGPKWSPASSGDRYALYNSSDVQGSVDGCNLFASLLKAECAIEDPVNVVYHAHANDPIAISVIDGFDKDIPCRGFLPPEFKKYFGTLVPVSVCPRLKPVVSDKVILSVILNTIMGNSK